MVKTSASPHFPRLSGRTSNAFQIPPRPLDWRTGTSHSSRIDSPPPLCLPVLPNEDKWVHSPLSQALHCTSLSCLTKQTVPVPCDSCPSLLCHPTSAAAEELAVPSACSCSAGSVALISKEEKSQPRIRN